MNTTIPGALADHLTTEPPLDLDTRAALDSARRGRGRTLVFEPRSMTALHVISRRAEQLLADAYATEPQKRAARTWLKRAGHAPQIITVRFDSTATAYDASQCSADLRSGDVLVVEDEQAVAFIYDAWPVAVTAAHGEFHGDGTAPTVEGRLAASHRAAIDAAHAIGAPLAREEYQQDAEQAVAEAAAADAPEATPTVEAALAAALRCTLHGDQCDHDPRRRHSYRATATEQAAARTAHLLGEARATTPTICPEFAALDPDDLIADEWRTAAQLVTEAEATDGTWRGAWIGEQQADDALFALDLDAEQGALFDDRATSPAAVEVEVEGVDRAAVDAHLAATYPALFAPEQPRPLELEPAFMWAVTHRVVIRGEWVDLIMCGLGRREADDRAGALRYTGSRAVEVVLCEHGPHAHRDARLAARCEGCGYAIPRGEQWHDACRPRPRRTPLERARAAAVRDAEFDRALEASRRAALDPECPF